GLLFVLQATAADLRPTRQPAHHFDGTTQLGSLQKSRGGEEGIHPTVTASLSVIAPRDRRDTDPLVLSPHVCFPSRSLPFSTLSGAAMWESGAVANSAWFQPGHTLITQPQKSSGGHAERWHVSIRLSLYDPRKSRGFCTAHSGRRIVTVA